MTPVIKIFFAVTDEYQENPKQAKRVIRTIFQGEDMLFGVTVPDKLFDWEGLEKKRLALTSANELNFQNTKYQDMRSKIRFYSFFDNRVGLSSVH